MKQITITLLFVLLFFSQSFGVAMRAGYISYTWLQDFTYKVDVYIYTKESSTYYYYDSIAIDYGDKTLDTLSRINGGGEDLGSDVLYNVYEGTHTYPGYGKYVISYSSHLYIGGMVNFTNSANDPFIIEDTLNLVNPKTSLGYNNSAIILNPLFCLAERNQVFKYSPAAYDADDDSLSFRLAIPEGTSGYVLPNQITGTPGNPTFTINQATGEITWNLPAFCGSYLISEVIDEWRRIQGSNPVLIGTVRLNMEINPSCLGDTVPVFVPIIDSCLLAGQTFHGNINARTPDAGRRLILSAVSGLFNLPVTNPPVFVPDTATAPAASFSWSTTCNDIRSQPYTVVFKALDNYPEAPLTSEQTLILPVNAPAPQDLTAVLSSYNSVTLNWDSSYACSLSTWFLGFFVWRKEGTDTSVFNNCSSSPLQSGYQLVAGYLNNYSFTDLTFTDSGTYNYRVTAMFGQLNDSGQAVNPAQSVPSNASAGIFITGVTNVVTNGGDINIYPNPVSTNLVMTCDNLLPKKISVMDLLGRTLLTENVSETKTTIDISSLAAGIYFVKVQCEGMDAVKKVVKE